MSFSLRRVLSLSTLALSVTALSLSACGDDGDTKPAATAGGSAGGSAGNGGHGGHGEGGHGGHGGGGHGHGPDSANCMGAAIFAPGQVSGMGATHKLTVIGAEPLKPVINFNNAWIVKLETMAGQPVDGATFKKFSPQMPHHGHGLPAENLVTVAAQPASGPGVYRVSNLAFNMPGYWKTEVMVQGTNPADNTAWADKIFVETCIGM